MELIADSKKNEQQIQTFHLFVNLPVDLRDLIWDAARPRQLIPLFVCGHISWNLVKTSTRPPSILFVNRKSRPRTLPSYKILYNDDEPLCSPLCYINYELDSIHLDEVSDVITIPKDRWLRGLAIEICSMTALINESSCALICRLNRTDHYWLILESDDTPDILREYGSPSLFPHSPTHMPPLWKGFKRDLAAWRKERPQWNSPRVSFVTKEYSEKEGCRLVEEQ
jgi:hypothetical protein